MKRFAILLALLITGMSCLPCVDELAMTNSDRQTVLTATDQDQHAAQPDLCSPLCICHCCGGFSIHNTPFQLATPGAVVAKQTAVHPIGFFLQPSFSFWQPPKI